MRLGIVVGAIAGITVGAAASLAPLFRKSGAFVHFGGQTWHVRLRFGWML